MDTLGTFTYVIQRLDGRDKFNTVIQETGRISAKILREKSLHPDLATRLKSLGDGISRCRAADRFLNSSVQFQRLMATAASSEEAIIKVPRMLIALGYVVFFYYDNKMFLGRLGVLKGLDYAALGKTADRIWFFCVSLSIFMHIMELRKAQREKRGTDEETQLRLYANCCDIWVAAKDSGFISGDEKVFRALTVLSALIGIRRICLSRARA